MRLWCKVVQGKLVGNSGQGRTKLKFVGVGCIVETGVLETATCIDHHPPMIEVFMKIDNQVTIILRRLVGGQQVRTLVGCRCKQRKCRSVVLDFIDLGVAVGSEPYRCIEPVKDIVLKASTQYDTFVVVDIEIAVGNPIRILDRPLLISVRPELQREAPAGIITLIRPVLFYLVASWKEVDGNDRIVIFSLREHVLCGFINVHQRGTKAQLVTDGIHTIVRNVVAVHLVVMYHSMCVIG